MDIPNKLFILSVVMELQQDVAENEADNLLQLQMYWNCTSMRVTTLDAGQGQGRKRFSQKKSSIF